MTPNRPHQLWLALAMPLAIAMLVFWAVMTFAFSAPGWVHLFLSLGVFLLIWRITAGGTEDAWERYKKSGSVRGKKKA